MNLAAGPAFTVPDINELFTYRSLIHPFKVGPVVFHFTYLTLVMFVLSFALCALFIAAFRRPAVVPGKLQNMMEAAIDAVRENIVLQTIGPDGDKFMPYLTAVFFFVFVMNFMEIVPGVQVPLTSFMAVPALFSLMAYLIFNFVGIRKQGVYHYFKDTAFPPGVPVFLYVILTPIELVSKFIFRPITLAVRLFANMMAGHVMLTIFFLASTYFLIGGHNNILRGMSIFPILLAIVLTGFEFFIAFIQAFIITILTAVYIDESLHPAH